MPPPGWIPSETTNAIYLAIATGSLSGPAFFGYGFRPMLRRVAGWQLATVYPDVANFPLSVLPVTFDWASDDVDRTNYIRAYAFIEQCRNVALAAPPNVGYTYADVWALFDETNRRYNLHADVFGYFSSSYEYQLLGTVLSLPFEYPRARFADDSALICGYALDCYLMSDPETKAAVVQMREWLRPWCTYPDGTYPLGVSRETPGFLSLYFQLHDTEALEAAPLIPSVRTLVEEKDECLAKAVGKKIFVRIAVLGDRTGAGDSRLPLPAVGGASWVYNHYGQVRLSYVLPPNLAAGELHTPWQWIRSRAAVHEFTVPRETLSVVPQVRYYGGLDISASVIDTNCPPPADGG